MRGAGPSLGMVRHGIEEHAVHVEHNAAYGKPSAVGIEAAGTGLGGIFGMLGPIEGDGGLE